MNKQIVNSLLLLAAHKGVQSTLIIQPRSNGDGYTIRLTDTKQRLVFYTSNVRIKLSSGASEEIR